MHGICSHYQTSYQTKEGIQPMTPIDIDKSPPKSLETAKIVRESRQKVIGHESFSEAKIILTICGRNRRRNQALKMEAYSAPLLFLATVIKMAEAAEEEARKSRQRRQNISDEDRSRAWEGRRREAGRRGGRKVTHYIRTRPDRDTPLHACVPPQCLRGLPLHKGALHGCPHF